MDKTKKIKTIQAEKIVNFKIAIPVWIPDEIAVDAAKLYFMERYAGEIFDLRFKADDTGKTCLTLLLERLKKPKQFTGLVPDKKNKG